MQSKVKMSTDVGMDVGVQRRISEPPCIRLGKAKDERKTKSILVR